MNSFTKHGGLGLIAVVFSFHVTAFTQPKSTYKVRTVAFYNVENLFDTHNDSLTFDDDRTPDGKDAWSIQRYQKKIGSIAYVLSHIGADVSGTSPDIVGLCEIENRQVLEDLVNHTLLKPKNYGMVHFDSPDDRGIDVALLYKESVFLPVAFQSRRLLLFNTDGERDFTRDQLVVEGILDGEPLFLLVNHWPSRSGGESKSRPHRIAAAQLSKRIMDSIMKTNQDAKIISMGDFNDDPTDDSLKKILKTRSKRDSIAAAELFNPMEKLFKKGVGSLAYRDSWNLFDQILVNGNLLDYGTTFALWKTGIHNPDYLITEKGKYKGYPFRTYSGGVYTGGYSDHFPVYAFLIKPVDVTDK